MSTVFQIYKGSIRWNLISKPYMGHFWGGVQQENNCIRTFAEQTTRTFLKLFLNYSKMLKINSGALIECFYDMIF